MCRSLSDSFLLSEGGFILYYDKTEENCTFDEIYDEKKEELKQKISKIIVV